VSRSNWLWPLLIVVFAVYLLASVAGAVPPIVADLVARGWPAALVLFGLVVLFGRRVRFATVIALFVTLALTVGIAVFAYAKQSGRVRTDYRAPIAQTLAPEITALKINLSTLIADIDISTAADRTISGEFVGSAESQVTTTFTVEQGVATLSITETRTSSLPRLDAIGRGKFALQLPRGVTLDTLSIEGSDGPLILDLSNATVRTLNIRVGTGALVVTLPAQRPEIGLGGNITTGAGDLTLTVPAGVTLKLSVAGGRPAFDQANYLLLSGNVLQSAGVRDFQVALTVSASGTVTVK